MEKGSDFIVEINDDGEVSSDLQSYEPKKWFELSDEERQIREQEDREFEKESQEIIDANRPQPGDSDILLG